MTSVLIRSPRWGGFFMGIAGFLMVVDQINIASRVRLLLVTENHPPVSGDGQAPEPFQRMRLPAWKLPEHEDENAKGGPSEMADKLRKLLFALETAASLEHGYAVQVRYSARPRVASDSGQMVAWVIQPSESGRTFPGRIV